MSECHRVLTFFLSLLSILVLNVSIGNYTNLFKKLASSLKEPVKQKVRVILQVSSPCRFFSFGTKYVSANVNLRK